MPSRAAAELKAADVMADAMASVWGIPFEEIDAFWEGGLKDWAFVVEGRLPGVETLARYEHRMSLGPRGWHSEGHLTLPPSRVANVAPLLTRFPALAGLSGSGTVGLTATITGRGKDKKWKGVLHLRDVSLEDQELKLSVEGLAGTLTWAFADGAFTSDPRQVLRFGELAWDEVQTRNGHIEFDLASKEEWRLERMTLDWAGGHLSADGLTLNPKALDVKVRLKADGILLEELLRLAPEFKGTGEGIIDGELSVRIHSEGVGLEPGHLALRAGAPARLQLPKRSWFTDDMSPEQASYDNLRMVERALEDLELSLFRLDFLSEEGRKAPLQLTIEGKPMAEDVPAPSVKLMLNVHGPLQELSSWALDPGVKIGVH